MVEKYRSKYRVEHDEDGTHIILCKGRQANGTRPHVYRWGDGELGFVGVGQAKKSALLKKHPGTFTVWLDCEDEFILRFPEERLPGVAKALECRRKRRVSQRERQRLREISPFVKNAQVSSLGAAKTA